VLLEDFARFCDEEPSPLERRTVLGRIWKDGGTIVAVPAAPAARALLQDDAETEHPATEAGYRDGSDLTRTRLLRLRLPTGDNGWT
jgi:hypothetical protein